MIGNQNFLIICITTLLMFFTSSIALAKTFFPIPLPPNAEDIVVEPDKAVVNKTNGLWEIDCFDYKGKVVISYKTRNSDGEVIVGEKKFNCGGD